MSSFSFSRLFPSWFSPPSAPSVDNVMDEHAPSDVTMKDAAPDNVSVMVVTMDAIRDMNATTLLGWVQGRLRVPLDDGDKAKFLGAKINGEAFLYAAGQMDFFCQAGIAMGPSLQLAQLAKIVDTKISKIDVRDPGEARRDDTVAALWKQLQQVRVIHARGTPTSGKSTLGRLLQDHVTMVHKDMIVWRFSWPPNISEKFLHRPFYYLLNDITNRSEMDSDDWPSFGNALLIIDEAQMSYDYGTFWNDFIKPLASGSLSGPIVLLLSSYGSASQTPVLGAKGSAPVELTAQQRISVRSLFDNNPDVSLYFSRQEFDDVVRRVCNHQSADGQLFLPTSELVDYIWEFSNGHPGGVRALLDFLIKLEELRPFLKASSPISLDTARKFLDDDRLLFTCLLAGKEGFKRSFPKEFALQENPELTELLRKVLTFRWLEDSLESNRALDTCYKRGWLQAESMGHNKIVYTFPTRIHRRYCELMLRNNAPSFPLNRFPSVKDLAFDVIRRFSRVSLVSAQRGLGAGLVAPPVEAQYQDEFYRACWEVLGNIYITSEWSGQSSAGRVDFQIKSVGWAIECLRDGNGLNEHIKRFLSPDGKYYRWVKSGEVQDYILLDFRQSMPQKVRDNIPFLFFVVFQENYAGYEIYDAKLNVVQERIVLLK